MDETSQSHGLRQLADDITSLRAENARLREEIRKRHEFRTKALANICSLEAQVAAKEAEITRLRDALQQARDLIADQLEAPRHLATIDTTLAAPSAEERR
jgi:septal ring factor EnvC (AmiA/AmiB activator)